MDRKCFFLIICNLHQIFQTQKNRMTPITIEVPETLITIAEPGCILIHMGSQINTFYFDPIMAEIPSGWKTNATNMSERLS